LGAWALIARPTKVAVIALVPRTRSSHHNCRESDCELRVQSGTRIIGFPVSFDSEVRFGACGKLRRTSESGHQPTDRQNGHLRALAARIGTRIIAIRPVVRIASEATVGKSAVGCRDRRGRRLCKDNRSGAKRKRCNKRRCDPCQHDISPLLVANAMPHCARLRTATGSMWGN
jgi:hypothetical protein